MEGLLSRETLGHFGQHGWRPSLLGWGIGSAIVALVWVIVIRFALGVTTLTDVAALGGVLVPFIGYMRERGANTSIGQRPTYPVPPEGGPRPMQPA